MEAEGSMEWNCGIRYQRNTCDIVIWLDMIHYISI